MTEPTRTRLRADHRLAPGQAVKPELAAATVGALFSAELLDALQRRGLLQLPPVATGPAAPAARTAQAQPTRQASAADAAPWP